jgi:hypothetical protein
VLRPLTWGLLLAAAPAPAWAWGELAHRRVTTEAIETLPRGLKTFYKDHRLEIPSLGLEPTPPADTPERRFALDALAAFPFADLPRTEAALKARHPEAAARVGRLPWLVHESYGRLVEAFRGGDKAKILAESDVLAALVADLHNPLALSENADGQKTEQHGLWIRFTDRLPGAMERGLKLDPEAARLLDEPAAYVFSMMTAVYVWLDNLLHADELAKRGKAGYTEIYYESFEIRAGRLLRDRLGEAAADVGSYWYTAWTAAGRPALR